MKTTPEAIQDFTDATRELVAALLRPAKRTIHRTTTHARRLPHRLTWWASNGIPAVVRNLYRSWRFEMERQHVRELFAAGLYDEYARAKNALCVRWGI